MAVVRSCITNDRLMMDWRAHLPLIAILRGILPEDVCSQVAELIDAGIGFIEIPCNSPRWRESVQAALVAAGQYAKIGAGTVTHAEQVSALAATGATFMVTPNTDPSVINLAVASGLSCVAGFATASEAFTALSAGAQALKLFPAEPFGPGYARALNSVLPRGVPLFAVGGISPANLGEFLQAGCFGAGLGSELYSAGQSAATTRTQARAFVAAFKSHVS
jgi:2-dehydro-3-deoxyphosphogalactonate aldolase